ncbi:MAG TPA: dipeptide/oligopeptide/nickel ABC transporter ATP-binding protein [Candidatus Blautia stercoripullorum]|uniref:Dipeptide/oligopeptide/nickel ABC transporter ATP-binding protein n=1 Tax=Candidatus Blautia stercoripullorum TaxID=2838502 RepID=A0A9D2U4U2_9FIRM|nr:dipeptide/oligopeptide/nickel ABC transporter ATP-binding protein [Candidatus Blautia stercoripullorum]
MEKILEVKNLRKTFYKSRSIFPAVEDVSFHLMRGECLGLVGESGCGKSTTARLIAGLLEPDRGSVRLEGEEILGLKGKKKQAVYTKLQMVFQTPQDSFDPRCTLGDGIMESMRNRGMKKDRARERMYQLLEQVELDRSLGERYPHEVSGGECQRAAIARALAVDPGLVICDEATSALDVTVQAQIVELLKRLQKERKLSLLFICHDLALVQHMCQRVLVMYQGKIIEQGTPDEVIQYPKEAYTRILVDSVL